jgi:RimJ/RimL family protein N-acetyltransferase
MNPFVELIPIGPEHAERMLQWMLDPEISENIGLRSPPTLERTQAWIKQSGGNEEICARAILHDGNHVGNVVLDRIDSHLQSARLSIYVGEASARGRGVAAAALRLALKDGFARQRLERIWLTVHERNMRAALLYTKVGFRLEGVQRGDFLFHGERVNAILMSILRAEFQSALP